MSHAFENGFLVSHGQLNRDRSVVKFSKFRILHSSSDSLGWQPLRNLAGPSSGDGIVDSCGGNGQSFLRQTSAQAAATMVLAAARLAANVRARTGAICWRFLRRLIPHRWSEAFFAHVVLRP